MALKKLVFHVGGAFHPTAEQAATIIAWLGADYTCEAHDGAAAFEAVRLFNQGEVTISPTVAEVDVVKCVGCGECIVTCPYTAIARNEDEKAKVNPVLCQGCGTCAATCPSGAITALHFTDEEIVAQIEGLLEVMV